MTLTDRKATYSEGRANGLRMAAELIIEKVQQGKIEADDMLGLAAAMASVATDIELMIARIQSRGKVN